MAEVAGGSFHSPSDVDFHSLKKLYRRYLYLDATEIINGLASIEEGQEEHRVREVIKELGGNVGAKFALLGVDVNLGGKGRRQLREELGYRQTIHSAAGSLLRRLTDGGAVARVRSGSDLDRVFETLTVMLDVDLQPLHPVAGPLRPLSAWRRSVTRTKAEDRAAESRAHELGGPFAVAYAYVVGAGERPPVALQLEAQYLAPNYTSDFCRQATVVGQVIYVTRSEDEVIQAKSVDGEGHLLVVTSTGEDAKPADPSESSPSSTVERHAPSASGQRRRFRDRFRRKQTQTIPSQPVALITSQATPGDVPAAPAHAAESAIVALTPPVMTTAAAERTGHESTPSLEEGEGGDGPTTTPRGHDKRATVVIKPLCIFK